MQKFKVTGPALKGIKVPRSHRHVNRHCVIIGLIRSWKYKRRAVKGEKKEPSEGLRVRGKEGLLQGCTWEQNFKGQDAVCLLDGRKDFPAKGRSVRAGEGQWWGITNAHSELCQARHRSKHFTSMSSSDPHVNPVR